MIIDGLSDLLTRMRNASLMKHPQVSAPHSRLKEAVLNVFKKEGLIKNFEVVGEKIKKAIVIDLKYMTDGQAVIQSLKRISKPSRRVYSDYNSLVPSRSGLGLKILSTSQGVMSDTEARKKKVGGEVLIEVW